MTTSPHIVETTAATFTADVYERSKAVPVVVDFWAAWCQPCRRLGPLLEAVASEFEGRFVLVKADVDQVPEFASAFRVEGIPAVFAVRGGEIVDSFVGLLTEAQLRDWLARILPSPAELLAAEGESLESSNPSMAAGKYREALVLVPNLATAQVGLARVLAAMGRVDEASAIITQLEDRGFLEPAAQRLKASLAISSYAISPAAIAELRARLAAGPAEAATQLKLAQAFIGAGQYEEGLAQAVEVVRMGGKDLREQARLTMLDVFALLGDNDDLTHRFRRELAMALY